MVSVFHSGYYVFVPTDCALNILVSGASSQIGVFLIPELVRQGHTCLCLSRSERADAEGIRWIKGNLNTNTAPIWQGCKADAWVHLAFLPSAIPHLKEVVSSGVRRFVGFSSTSVFTKKAAESGAEQRTIQELVEAEASVESICQAQGIGWTLFRPTMIYGCGMDQNIAFIQRVIDRFGAFPVAGKGKGLRQPVHAEDLALACIAVLDNVRALNKAYNLSGGETLAYREMVERIFHALNHQPRIIHLPAPMYKFAIAMLKRISSRYAFLQTSMVDRMNMDMVFDHNDAANDFGYNPKSFQP